MRILSITHMLGPGGLERAVQNCSLEYRRRGHESAVLSYDTGGVRVEPIRAGGVPVFLPERGLDDAIEQARAWGPDVVHAHRAGMAQEPWGRIFERLSAGRGRVPVVETNHFARVDYSADRLAIDVHVHLSRWCLWKWRAWARGVRPSPLGVVVPHMVLADSFYRDTAESRAEFRRAHGIPDDAVLFGRVGQPVFAKWSGVMFDAFARVAQRQPRAWLLIVGLPPELRPALEALAPEVRQRIAEIEFLHGDDPLRRCYSAMDVFLHASTIGESFGYVLCEAMLCQTPVITLNRPLKDNSQLEVVGHRRGGLVVCDAGSMAEAMELLIRDAGLRAELGRGGAAWVREAYSPERVGTDMLRVLGAAAEAAGNRERLGAALRDLSPDVRGSEIARLAHECMGRPSRRSMLLLPAVNNPRVYRLWRTLKFGIGGRRTGRSAGP